MITFLLVEISLILKIVFFRPLKKFLKFLCANLNLKYVETITVLIKTYTTKHIWCY